MQQWHEQQGLLEDFQDPQQNHEHLPYELYTQGYRHCGLLLASQHVSPIPYETMLGSHHCRRRGVLKGTVLKGGKGFYLVQATALVISILHPVIHRYYLGSDQELLIKLGDFVVSFAWLIHVEVEVVEHCY